MKKQFDPNHFKDSKDYQVIVFNNATSEYPKTIRMLKQDMVKSGINYYIKRYMSKEEIKRFLHLSENGIDDLCDTSKLPFDYEDMSLNEFYDLLIDRPHFLRGLLVMDDYDAIRGWRSKAKPLFESRYRQIKKH